MAKLDAFGSDFPGSALPFALQERRIKNVMARKGAGGPIGFRTS